MSGIGKEIDTAISFAVNAMDDLNVVKWAAFIVLMRRFKTNETELLLQDLRENSFLGSPKYGIVCAFWACMTSEEEIEGVISANEQFAIKCIDTAFERFGAERFKDSMMKYKMEFSDGDMFYDYSLLHFATAFQYVHLMRSIVSKKVSINLPMHAFKSVRLVSGEMVRTETPYNITPIFIAIDFGSTETVKEMLDPAGEFQKIEQINIVAYRGYFSLTPLQYAISANAKNTDLFDTLIDHLSDHKEAVIDALLPSGLTLLQCALANEDEALVDYLLSKGADPRAPAGMPPSPGRPRSKRFLKADEERFDAKYLYIRSCTVDLVNENWKDMWIPGTILTPDEDVLTRKDGEPVKFFGVGEERKLYCGRRCPDLIHALCGPFDGLQCTACLDTQLQPEIDSKAAASATDSAECGEDNTIPAQADALDSDDGTTVDSIPLLIGKSSLFFAVYFAQEGNCKFISKLVSLTNANGQPLFTDDDIFQALEFAVDVRDNVASATCLLEMRRGFITRDLSTGKGTLINVAKSTRMLQFLLDHGAPIECECNKETILEVSIRLNDEKDGKIAFLTKRGGIDESKCNDKFTRDDKSLLVTLNTDYRRNIATIELFLQGLPPIAGHEKIFLDATIKSIVAKRLLSIGCTSADSVRQTFSDESRFPDPRLMFLKSDGKSYPAGLNVDHAVDYFLTGIKNETEEEARERSQNQQALDIAKCNKRLDAVEESLKKLSHTLKTLTNSTAIPPIFLLLPFSATTYFESLKSPFQSLYTNKYLVTFIDPVSLEQIKCGPCGKGFPLARNKEWFRKALPGITLSISILKLVSSFVPHGNLVSGILPGIDRKAIDLQDTIVGDLKKSQYAQLKKIQSAEQKEKLEFIQNMISEITPEESTEALEHVRLALFEGPDGQENWRNLNEHMEKVRCETKGGLDEAWVGKANVDLFKHEGSDCLKSHKAAEDYKAETNK